jgi:O-antigen biosynthesis protein
LAFISFQSSFARTQDANLAVPENRPTIVEAALLSERPLISIFLATHNTPTRYLESAVNSVLSQIYDNWELIIVDDASSSSAVKKLISRLSQKSPKIQIRLRAINGHISKALNDCLELANGSYFCVLDHDDTLSEDALYWVAKCISETGSPDYIYSDEDKLSANGRRTYGEFYKPSWSPEYFFGLMYTCHLSVFRLDLVRELGGFRSEYDGAQDYDLALRVISISDRIVHIPRILYHWRVWANSTANSLKAKPYALNSSRKALEDYLQKKNENFIIRNHPREGHHIVSFLPKGEPKVSILIPTANGKILRDGTEEENAVEVVQSILRNTDYTNYEILLIHNGDLTDCQNSLFQQLPSLSLVHYSNSKFSLSEKINLGASFAEGELLVLMNDDIRVTQRDWLTLMVGMVQRDGVGIVAPKLVFPNGLIQHAGVVILGGLPGHPYYQASPQSDGYGMSITLNRNYSAVTGACSITPKTLFMELGGYSADFPLNYNDVDYCLRAGEIGFRSVYLADVTLIHFEGISKPGGRQVAPDEVKRFRDTWGERLARDPFYNPNLNQEVPY